MSTSTSSTPKVNRKRKASAVDSQSLTAFATSTPASAAKKQKKSTISKSTKKTKSQSTSVLSQDEKDSERYQYLTDIEHVLKRPDTYIGSVKPCTVEGLWVAEPDTEEKLGYRMEQRDSTVVMGLYKVLDELLTNAADNVQRTRDKALTVPTTVLTKTIKVEVKGDTVSVYNDGQGIPVVEHTKEKKLIPTMIFGTLRTSENYRDNDNKIIGGKNGVGAKCTNIYAIEFTVETVDVERGKKFKQTWRQNMSVVGPPKVSTYKGKPYTRVTVTPDYKRFGLSGLSGDNLALFRKRVIDLAGVMPDVGVYLDGRKLPIRSFQQYAELYVGKDVKRIYESPNERWCVLACASPDGMPRQMSFVNCVWTINGGEHVNYLSKMIGREMASRSKKKRGADLRSQDVRNNLWLFINSKIENYAFSSQTKETLTTDYKDFGSTCKFSDGFYSKLERSEVADRAQMMRQFHEKAGLRKTDGRKCRSVKGIDKLEDANWAGGKKSAQCTLILTEGDSAKTFALSAMKVLSRDKYGIFPLKGKPINVREKSAKAVAGNDEIEYIKKIVGLQQGKVYTDLSELRYGKIMILADSDVDGIHIKGLVLNFIDFYWPSLVEMGFVVYKPTHLIKIRRGKIVVASFFSEEDYSDWKQAQPSMKGLKVKYYKGLGTSTKAEAIECFKTGHEIKFLRDPTTKKSLDMVFGKGQSNQRKKWLIDSISRTRLDYSIRSTTITDFVQNEMPIFSNADNERSIESAVDGLKPSLRKIIFGVLKLNQVSEIKVADLTGPISSASNYHHGPASLEGAMIGMAQNYVGCGNNINLMVPVGGFGSRQQGGKDAASARYTFTHMSPILKKIFKAEDMPLLRYAEEDGKSYEPHWYLPVIPMVLVNAGAGIGTGFSSTVPPHNPKDIIRGLRKLIHDQTPDPLVPWFRFFKGKILKRDDKWLTQGVYKVVSRKEVHITELPIGLWTADYKVFLDSLVYDSSQSTKKLRDRQCITSWKFLDGSDEISVKISLKFKANELKALSPEDLCEKLNLQTDRCCNSTNMHLYDPTGVLVKFPTPDDILKFFYKFRLPFYTKRKQYLLDVFGKEIDTLREKVRFVEGTVQGTVKWFGKSNPQVVREMVQRHNFLPNPMNRQAAVPRSTRVELLSPVQPHVVTTGIYKRDWVEEMKERKGEDEDEEGDVVMGVEDEEGDDVDEKEDTSTAQLHQDYGYLFGMNMFSLRQDKADALKRELNRKEQELSVLASTTPQELWLHDLQEIDDMLDQTY
jgi:DNA topoisomerase-2